MVHKRKANSTTVTSNLIEGESKNTERRQVAKKPRKEKSSTNASTTWPEYFDVVRGLLNMTVSLEGIEV
jgi:hypothetical protein